MLMKLIDSVDNDNVHPFCPMSPNLASTCESLWPGLYSLKGMDRRDTNEKNWKASCEEKFIVV